jgi:L-ascorbate metabolism protein UlaG (beta-lactamase superfamily)
MEIKITYIGHSGFLIELESAYLLFDYYKGEIPKLELNKTLFVFVSHKHGDHYNPEILQLRNQYNNVQYILSSDIKLDKDISSKVEGTESIALDFLTVKPSKEYELKDVNNNQIMIKTLKSTDCGVAFLIHYLGKTIYHAGDLNLWVWKEETKQFNNNMTAMFEKEMAVLKGLSIDIAFVPMDPRQEEWYSMGINQFINTATVQYIFPMHFWDKPEIIQQYKKENSISSDHTKVMDILNDGQYWELEI